MNNLLKKKVGFVFLLSSLLIIPLFLGIHAVADGDSTLSTPVGSSEIIPSSQIPSAPSSSEEASSHPSQKSPLNQAAISTSEGFSEPMLMALNPGEVSASSYAELRAILIVPPVNTTIVLTGDIQMASGGIPIHSAWTTLTIDGKDPNTGTIHTITEYMTNNYNDTIHSTSQNFTNATLKNLSLSGKNYYGTLCIHDAYSGVSLTYQNVTYTGPQMTYNRNGTANYIDTIIKIEPNGGASNAQEVAEITNVVLGGNISIVSTSTSDSLFWLVNAGGAINVLEDSVVDITVANYGCYMNSLTNTLSIGKSASLSYSGNGGVTYDSMYFQSVFIDTGASFSAERKDASGYAVLRIGSKLTVMEGGSLLLTNTNSSGPTLHMVSSNPSVTFDSPQKVLLLAPNGKAIRFDQKGTLTAATKTINLWNTLPSGMIDSITNVPTQIWNQPDGSVFKTTATVTNLTTSNISTAWEGETTQWNQALTQANYTFESAKALLFGSHEIAVDQIKQGSSVITGTVDPNAEIEIYSGTTKIGSATADSMGLFSAAVNSSLLVEGTRLSILTNHDEIKAYTFSTVIEAGSISFVSVPTELSFGTIAIPNQPTYVYRSADPWVMEISDTRGSGSTWRIDAEALSSLTNSSGNTLDSSFVFVSSSTSQVISNSAVTIYDGTTGSSSDISLTWAHAEGPILWINSISDIEASTNYTATIEWSLIDAP